MTVLQEKQQEVNTLGDHVEKLEAVAVAAQRLLALMDMPPTSAFGTDLDPRMRDLRESLQGYILEYGELA